MTIMKNDPECAKWNLWIGKEIEGENDLGVCTLFIRAASMPDIKKTIQENSISRVWFCKEYLATKMYSAEFLCSRYPNITFVAEVTYDTINTLYSKLRRHVALYLKMPELTRLKAGDHVCVGPTFQDEAFLIGTGRRVKPEDYGQDIWIK